MQIDITMTAALNIVCWKWNPLPGVVTTKKKREYTAEDVNVLFAMLCENLRIPFNMICVTDDPVGIDKDIRIVPLWKELREKGGCFTRLVAFKKSIKSLFGSRFASIDLDCIIVGDVTHIFDRDDDFIIWGGHHSEKNGIPYCGSLWMMLK